MKIFDKRVEPDCGVSPYKKIFDKMMDPGCGVSRCGKISGKSIQIIRIKTAAAAPAEFS